MFRTSFLICALLAFTSAVRAEVGDVAGAGDTSAGATNKPAAPAEARPPAHEQGKERTLSLEVASGVVVLGDGPHMHEGGLVLDLGLAWTPLRYLVARTAIGCAALLERHGPYPYVRARAEVAARVTIAGLVPMLGAGGAVWNHSPSLYGVFGLAVQFARTWQLGVDVRSGPFWDRYDRKPHRFTPYGEGSIRMSWAFH
jgi:hypothetical protein